MAHNNSLYSANQQLDETQRGGQHNNSAAKEIFSWGYRNTWTDATDAETMARVPAASVISDSLLHNSTLGSTSTMAAGLAFNRTDISDGEALVPVDAWVDTTLHVLKATIMISIIVAAIFGNLLVIASVMRVRKLRYVFVA